MTTRPRRRVAALGVLAALGLPLTVPWVAGADETSPTASPTSSPTAEPTVNPSATPEPPRPDPRDGLAGVEDLEPVLGSSYGSQAPTLTSGGRYIDTTPAIDDFRFYRVPRTMTGSTVAFGLTMLGPDVNPRRRPSLRIYTRIPDAPAGERQIRLCGVARVDDTDKATVMPVASLAGWTWDDRPLCRDTSEFIIAVANAYDRAGEPALMTAADAPYELDVWEQPAIRNAAELTQVYNDRWVYDAPGTPSVQAEPGLAPVSATVLPAGETVAVDLTPGQVGWFAVPVEIGEHLQALVTTADGAALAGAGFELRLFSPVGGSVLVADPTFDPPATAVGNLAAGPNLLSAVTGEVFPGNRTDNANSTFSHHSALTAVGGHYLLAVYVQALDAAPVTSLPVLVKTRLDQHDGFPGDGYREPDFASALTPFPVPVGPEPTAYVAPVVSDSPVRATGRTSGDWALIGGLGLAALVFAGVGGALVRRRT